MFERTARIGQLELTLIENASVSKKLKLFRLGGSECMVLKPVDRPFDCHSSKSRNSVSLAPVIGRKFEIATPTKRTPFGTGK
jgi:hypothetical protein